jgi:hypothetical protein
MLPSLPTGFQDVPRPPGLEIDAIRRAIAYIEGGLPELIEIYLEQANVFSALVGIFGTKALDQVSQYEKHKHLHTAQQRFPDLCLRGCGRPPEPNHCLESKGSKRPWEIQSHYNHEGWYIVWRYLVDMTETIQPGRPVIIWRVDVVYLTSTDWKYEASRAGEGGGGRTHTFGVRKAAQRLRGCAVYQRPGIAIRHGKPITVAAVQGS